MPASVVKYINKHTCSECTAFEHRNALRAQLRTRVGVSELSSNDAKAKFGACGHDIHAVKVKFGACGHATHAVKVKV